MPFSDRCIETGYNNVNSKVSRAHVAAYQFVNAKPFAEMSGEKVECLYAHFIEAYNGCTNRL